MERKFGSLTTTFDYEYHRRVLTKTKKRSIPFISSNKYDLQMLSNDLPDAIYSRGETAETSVVKSFEVSKFAVSP